MNFFDLIAPIYEIFHFGAGKTFKILDEFGGFQKTDKVLDLGGGTGRISKFLVGRVKEIIVLDLSSNMIKKCQSHFGLSCFVGSAEKISFPDNYFDKVIIIDAFHHFQNQETACQEVKRVLKPEGKILIEEFNPQKFSIKLIIILEKLTMMKSRFYSPFTLSQLFENYKIKTKLINEERPIYYLIGGKH